MAIDRWNLEWKGRLPSSQAAAVLRQRLQTAADQPQGLGPDLPDVESAGWLEQIDTYFACRLGRLKLREIAGSQAELIWYQRQDQPEARSCRYRRVAVAGPREVRAGCQAALGIETVVRKRRQLFWVGGTRVHLDEVESLGDFLEFEVVRGGDVPNEEAHGALRRLMTALEVEEAWVEPRSYRELQQAHDRASGSRLR